MKNINVKAIIFSLIILILGITSTPSHARQLKAVDSIVLTASDAGFVWFAYTLAAAPGDLASIAVVGAVGTTLNMYGDEISLKLQTQRVQKMVASDLNEYYNGSGTMSPALQQTIAQMMAEQEDLSEAEALDIVAAVIMKKE